MRFVVTVAKQYQNKKTPLLDIINNGNIGLMKAAQRFDETTGYKFISYAVSWIQQSILEKQATDEQLVRAPLNKQQVYSKILRLAEEISEELENENITPESFERIYAEYSKKLAQDSEITTATIREAFASQFPDRSFDAPLNTEGSYSLGEITEDTNIAKPDSDLLDKSLEQEVDLALKELLKGSKDKRAVEIIKMYYGIGYDKTFSLEEIGEILGKTRERVRQILSNALLKMRENPKISNQLRKYLG